MLSKVLLKYQFACISFKMQNALQNISSIKKKKIFKGNVALTAKVSVVFLMKLIIEKLKICSKNHQGKI